MLESELLELRKGPDERHSGVERQHVLRLSPLVVVVGMKRADVTGEDGLVHRLRSDLETDHTPQKGLCDTAELVRDEGEGAEEGLTGLIGRVGVEGKGEEDNFAKKLGREKFEHARSVWVDPVGGEGM